MLPLRTIRFAALLLLTTAAKAQLAAPTWLPADTTPGPHYPDSVHASCWWDPDGPGPRGDVIVLGGLFTIDAIGAANLAWFDPATTTWGAFDANPDGTVTALCRLADGSLAVAGGFANIGGLHTGGLVFHAAGTWSVPASGLVVTPTSSVCDIVQLPNGDVVAAGVFTQPDSGAQGLARWDGSQWHAYPFPYSATAMTMRPNGNLIVAGWFTGRVAEWNGLGWTTLPLGSYSPPSDIALLGNGEVVVTELVNGMWRWDGATWTQFGGFLPWISTSFAIAINGDLLVADAFPANPAAPIGIYRWNGVTWLHVADRLAVVRTMLELPNGELFVGASTNSFNFDLPAAIWRNGAWQRLADGFDDTVRGVAALRDGGVMAYGDFRSAEGTASAGFARWHGSGWTSVSGSGYGSSLQQVRTHATGPDGTTWFAADTPLPGTGGNIARWSGTTFVASVASLVSPRAITFDASGAPIVGCATYSSTSPRVVRWSGTGWSELASSPPDGPVGALTHDANEDLVAGGDFLFAGGAWLSHVARFDGTAWQPLATGLDGSVRAFATLPDGSLIAGGEFQNDGWMQNPMPLVARWDGAAWQPLGAGLQGAPGASVHALLVLPNGDLLAGGDFTHSGATSTRGVARWDGATWHEVDGGVDGTVYSLTMTGDGEVWAGGDFQRCGGGLSAHLARLRSDVPAAITHRGTGCPGSTGPLALQVEALPWLGGAFRVRCASLAHTAVGVVLFGFTPTTLPLSTLHPAAGSSCSLLSSGELLWLQLPDNGALRAELPLPGNPALLGATFHCQVLAAELGAAGITLLAGSDAVELTLGAF